jgi:hypothetical protein
MVPSAQSSLASQRARSREIHPRFVSGLTGCGKTLTRDWPALKRRIEVEPCFRSAEALQPPHKCEGSHRAPGPSAGWEPSALAEGSNASALRERVR